MRKTAPILAVLVLIAAPLSAANFGAADTFRQEFPIDPDGVVVIDNPFGNINVTATDGSTVTFTAQKMVRGSDAAALAEARDQTALITSGDQRTRLIKTQVPLLHNQRWSSFVNYDVRVPRGAQVKIVSNSGDRIRVAGLSGGVNIKNWIGQIAVESVTGPTVVDSLNGSIAVNLTSKPRSNLQLTTVNGHIDVTAPSESAFKWVAQSLKGELLTTFPVAGKPNGAKYIGIIGGAAQPVISTASMMGNTVILRHGSRVEQARSIRATSHEGELASMSSTPVQTYQKAVVEGPFIYSTALGNVNVGRVRGAARVETRAGEVQLGVVHGQCDIMSFGGPLTLGDIFGPLTARTSAGDISINAARHGAMVSTGGGMIRILWASGALNLHTEGGDIIVRQAQGAVTADTLSGDVSLGVDPGSHESAIDLRTAQGNISLSISPTFAADIDAVVMTSDADSNPIHSDFNGLTVDRKTVGGKTRIHATGKLNGGGERVTLYAEDGDIHITVTSPVSEFGSHR